MEEKLVLTSISVDELLELITASVKKELTVAAVPEHSSDDLLDRKEAAALLRITLPTLREYTRQRILKGYRLGTRVRYKRSEVIEALRPMDFETNGTGPRRLLRKKRPEN